MKNHLKAYAAPKSWTFLRKVTKWVIRPRPGAHELERAMPIALLLKQTGNANTTKEAKYIINQKAVTIDGRLIKDIHASTGFLDSIQIKPDTTLRGTLDTKGRLQFIQISASEASKKLCKITGKTTVPGGKTQLNLSNGRNIITTEKYNTGDSLLLEVPKQKIVEHFPLQKGSTVFLTGGRHIGTTGTIENIDGNRVWCKTNKETIETLKKFALVIGKDKPAIKL